jgi:hypothetical protein
MKKILLAGASALAMAAGAGWLATRRIEQSATPPEEWDKGEITRNFLLYFILPLWLWAGVADWLCHRAADIEHTAGPEESLMHLAMLIEIGVPSLAGLFLEITAPLFALMIAAFALHEATALWDVTYAASRRTVTPFEQHVHSFLELIPLMAISALATLHWPQFLATFGLVRKSGGRPLRRKQQPLPGPYVATLLGAITLFEWLPYLEELRRCLRVATEQRRIAGG